MIGDAEEIAAAALLDREYYAKTYPDVAASGTDPLEHFCRFGWREGRQPNPWFDTEWYLAQNQDVCRAGLNPLVHYIRHGEEEGRRPTACFHVGWYAAAYGVPRRGALRHFLAERITGTALPCADLYPVPHLPEYRACRVRGEDPFLRYLADGADPSPDALVIAMSGIFDPNHYFITASDVQERAIDPIVHFCRHGWREHRRPCLYFDPRWYLRTNPSVCRLGINPLAHYILEGEAAGRRPVVFFDPAWYRARYGLPARQSALAHYLAHRRGQQVSPTPRFDVEWYVTQSRIGRNRDPFAHFLRAGTYADVDPSPDFDAAAYRRRHLGRLSRHFRYLLSPERDNPLIHWLETTYDRPQEPEGDASEIPALSAP
jgi:hypothetical protein